MPDQPDYSVLLAELTRYDPGTLAAAYVYERSKRDRCREIEAMHKARMSLIESVILGKLNTLQQDGFRAANHGPLVFKKTLTTASCSDPEAFMQFCIDNGEFDLLERRASKDAIENYAEEHSGVLPPGVTLNKIVKLGVNK